MVGQRLRRLRCAWGGSLRELARLARYSPSQLGRVEREEVPPPAPSHRLYAAAGELVGAGEARALARAARKERGSLLDGIPWWRRGR
jgi:transcriptional regulator with XRE-family HTH domain